MRRFNREKVNKMLIMAVLVLAVILLCAIGLLALMLRSDGVDSMDKLAMAMDMIADGEDVDFTKNKQGKSQEVLIPADDEEQTSGTGASKVTVDRSRTPASYTPTMLVLSINSETGRIEQVFVEIFKSEQATIDLIHVPSEVSYIMSSSLFEELTVGNPKLPQCVTLSELYRYYHTDAAYEAARRIVSEMINFNLLYYTVLYSDDMKKYVDVREHAGGYDYSLEFSTETALSERYGSLGSADGFISYVLGNAKTNWPLEDRFLFLDVYDSMTEDSVVFSDAPVITYNESKEIDRNAFARMIYDIIY